MTDYQSPLPFLLHAARRQGDFVPLGQNSFLVCHPNGVRHVLQDNHPNYRRSPLLAKAGPLLGEGLVTSEGSSWLRQRRLMQPAFHYHRLTNLAQTMVEVLAARLPYWQDVAREGRPLDVAAEMKQLTMQIVVAALFGFDLGDQTGFVGQAFHLVVEQLRRRLRGAAGDDGRQAEVGFQAALAQLDAIVYRMIGERRQKVAGPGALLTMLLEARDPETDQAMDDRQLRDEVMTLFVSGHETTTDALTWLWYGLAQHPAVEESLRAEIDGRLAGRLPTPADLPDLPYLKMVIEEGLRFYPPVGLFGRSAVNDDQINGHFIPAGAQVILSPYVTHRHPTFWANPDHFDPTHFAAEQVAVRPRFAYFPFGGGPRQCIGNHFALLEMQLVVAMIVGQGYRLRLLPGPLQEPQPTTTLPSGRGVLMALTRDR
ncbi:MAG: cytochrome P450 [Chloroflexota bacterium]